MKTPKKKRSRLPALSLLERKGFQAEMGKLKRLSQAQKDTVMASLNAAANPNAENPLLVIQTMDVEERLNIAQASAGYQQLLGGIGARGRMNLMADAELDSLIESEDA